MCNINRIPFADLYWQRELLLLDGDSLTVTDMLLNYAGWRSFVRASPTQQEELASKGRFYVVYAKMHHQFA